MPEGYAGVDAIGVATAIPGALQHAGQLQVGDDPLNRPLGDAHARGDLAQGQVAVCRQAHQHVRVVAQEGPAGGLLARH
jgi:hypothetical protein